MLQYITTGESHGQYLATILQGMPSGLNVEMDFINGMLRERQGGYGRGGRQRIETDTVEILGGVVKGKTTGAPVGFVLKNKDFVIDKMPELFRPRPGHADLAGALKYDQGIRPVLERASARETAMRVAVGALCKLFLQAFGMRVVSHVVRIGATALVSPEGMTVEDILKGQEGSELKCVCRETEKKMIAEIDAAKKKKDTVGGQYEVRVAGLPIGLGSFVHFERKLDARLAQHLMGMQSIKAVEMGAGSDLGHVLGSEAHDEIFYDAERGYYRKTNRAGGLEGGMTNGADLIVRATMKPIATLAQPMASVNMQTKETEQADFERSDTCAVAAGSIIGECLVAYVVADAFLEKFGGDSMKEIERSFKSYLKDIHA